MEVEIARCPEFTNPRVSDNLDEIERRVSVYLVMLELINKLRKVV